jgi:subtilisin family serine protease
MSRPRRLALLVVLGLAVGAPGARAALPDDPLLAHQWPLMAVGAPAAWTQADGAGTIVALLDTGVDLDHPDLAPALWTNLAEIPGNGRDDDGDGIADDRHGADFVDGDGDPSDPDGHGTHDAGLIAAAKGDGIGMAGLAPGAQLMAIRVLGARRRGPTTALVHGIRYALDHGARILVAPVNSDHRDAALAQVLQTAAYAGAVVVASAGNEGRDLDARPSYPAADPSPAVLAVGGLDRLGRVAPFSDTGSRTVDLYAPGDDVLSAAPGGGYARRSGTSPAAALAGGALAVMRSARPEVALASLRQALVDAARAQDGRLDLRDGLRRAGAWTGPAGPLVLHPRAVGDRRRVLLRWRASGDRAAVARYLVWLDARVVAFGPRRSVGVALKPGRHRASVAALDPTGAALAVATLRLTTR